MPSAWAAEMLLRRCSDAAEHGSVTAQHDSLAAQCSSLTTQRGSVTAELALLLPGLVLVLGLCLASIQLAAQQVLLQDVAGIAARALGRGEPLAEALRAGEGRLQGVQVSQRRQGGLICLTLSQPRALAGVIPVTLRASSCAAGAGR